MSSQPPDGNNIVPPPSPPPPVPPPGHQAARREAPIGGFRRPGRRRAPASPPHPQADWTYALARLSGLGHAAWALIAGIPAWLRARSFFPSWLPLRWRHPLTGYLATLLVQALATLLTVWLLAEAPPFPFAGTLTLLGVVLVALTFGAGPSLAAVLLGSAMLLLLVLPSWLLRNLATVLSVGTLTAIGIIISVLVSRVEHARREAVAAAQARDTFLFLAAHELRTPLTSYMGVVQLARRHLARLAVAASPRNLDLASDAEMIADVLARADAATVRQNRLINELLDVSRIQMGMLTLRFAPCELGAIVRAAVEEQELLQPDRALRLNLPARPVPVAADAERIGEVVSEYLSNALKYAPADQLVEVALTVTAYRARVTVRDHGPGLSPDEQAQVWNLYHRVPGIEVVSGSDIGLGLGLYLCRTIVLAHPGGQVGVDSAAGEGSSFWFALPLAEGEAGASD